MFMLTVYAVWAILIVMAGVAWGVWSRVMQYVEDRSRARRFRELSARWEERQLLERCWELPAYEPWRERWLP